MRIDKYSMAKGWMMQEDATPEEAKATWDTLEKEFEDNRKMLLASAETDEIKNMINKKYGSGTMKYGSEISQPPQRPDVIEIDAVNAFMKRNPRAEGGRMGFEKGLLVEDLTEAELVNAQSAARKKGITGAKDSQEFADFVGGDTYTRLSTKKSERLETKNIKAAETAKSLDINEIAKLPADTKLSFNQRTKLLDSYHDFFKEAYNERVKLGEPFGKADIARDVIKKIELKYPDQADNLDFFPGKSKDLNNPASYYEYIDPKKQSSKFRKQNSLANTLTKEQMSIFKGNEAKALKQTKNQEKIFKALQNGINEIDDLVKETGMTKARVNQETAKLVNNMFVRTNEVPMFLRGADAQNAIGDVYNALVDSKTMAGFHTRNIRSMIYDSFPNDLEVRKFALSKVKEFDKFTKDLKTKFPGLEINYDHPGSYRALKNLDFKNFLNVTPIVKDINAFKSRFDNQSIKNLNDLAEAKANYGPNSLEYKAALKKQRSLERVWSNLTGDKSSLGKLRLNRQQTGTSGLDTEGKNLIEEFTGNLKIREEIAKNIDESVKFYDPNSKTEKTIFESLEEVLPTKRGTTQTIESAKKITSKDALDFDKQISDYITGKTNKPPMVSSGLAGAYDQLLNEPAIKALKNTKGYRAVAKAANVPGKFFGVGDILLGALDYENNISKGQTEQEALKNALQMMAFGAWKIGDKERLSNIKKLAVKNGMNEDVFDSITYMNKKTNLFQETVNQAKFKYDDFKKSGMDADAEKIKVDAGKRLTKIMGDITTGQSSLITNVRVDEAGAPIDINVDDKMLDAYKNVRSTGVDYATDQAAKVYDKRKRFVNETSGKYGEKFLNSILTADSYKKLLPQNWLSTLNQMIPYMPYKPVTEKEKESKRLQDMDERELYLYNKANRGMTPDQPLSGKAMLEFILQNPEIYGSPQSYFDGGIASLRRKNDKK